MLQLKIDVSELEKYVFETTTKFYAAINNKIKLLAAQTHAHIIEQAQSRLHSRREDYLEALEPPQKVEAGLWAISLKKSGLWIEEGQEPYRNER
jgi:hypothetical protein